MKDIKALLGAKKQIDPMDKMAKIKALKDMRKMAGDMMADGVKDKMSQVTVAAPDKQGLAEGLDKAKQLMSPEDHSVAEAAEEKDENPLEEKEESPMEEDAEMLDSCDTPEKIDEMMKKLAEKKAILSAKG